MLLVMLWLATLRKKDKEFERLQAHLQKQVKDASRGSAKPGIVVSKALAKNSSQTSARPAATLRDAELLAAHSTVRAMEVGPASGLRMLCNCSAMIICPFVPNYCPA